MIPYGKQAITDEDVQAVVEVLQSDFRTQGPRVPIFEAAIAEYVGAEFGVAANSATSALHVACLALGIGSGSLVWTTPNTFVASANCVLYCRAEIDFVDIDSRTYNICPVALEKKLIDAKANGTSPDLLIVVHFAGRPCEMERIYELSQEFNFDIIEDASHAIGAEYRQTTNLSPNSISGENKNRKVGCCLYSKITVFSFHPVKLITTAEGGLATTNDEQLAQRMELFRGHGIVRNGGQIKTLSHGITSRLSSVSIIE